MHDVWLGPERRFSICEVDHSTCWLPPFRADLSPAERSYHVAERKRVYEKLKPETKHGANQHTKRSRRLGDSSNDRFTADTAAKTGQSERKVQRDAQRGESLGAYARKVVGSSLDEGDELDALAQLDKQYRDELIDRSTAQPRAIR